MQLKIGTRQSNLALQQTNLVIEKINTLYPNKYRIEVVPIITTGDKITDRNLYNIGGKALFLKEIEEYLIDNKIDMAVHSLKDVPGILPKGLKIAGVLEREDPRDCFISTRFKSLIDLPGGAIIGSSSVRRGLFIKNIRPDIKLVQFRGNINTRLEKIKSGEVDASFLACAGLYRANLFNKNYCFPVECNRIIPAAGQGTIGIEIRIGDNLTEELCKSVNHPETWLASQAERSFLTYLNASCKTPMAAYAKVDQDKIYASYMLSSIDGRQMEFLEQEAPFNEAAKLGILAAEELKSRFKNFNNQVLGI